MRTNKLFYVLVVAGGALGATACSSADENPAPTHRVASSQSGDADGGDDAATADPPANANANASGSGSHFW